MIKQLIFTALLTVICFNSSALAQSNVYMRSSAGLPWGRNGNELAMNAAFGTGNWRQAYYESSAAHTVFDGNARFVFMEGGDYMANTLENYLAQNASTIEAWVMSGGRLLINAAPNTGNGMSCLFGITLHYPGFSGSVSVAAAGHPVFAGPATPTGSNFGGNYATHAYVSGSGLSPVLRDSSQRLALAEKSWGAGHVMAGGLTLPWSAAWEGWGYGYWRNLHRNLLVHAAGGAKLTQKITFGSLADVTYGASPFTVSATGGGSGNPVTFSAQGPCAVSGNLVSVSGVGTCTITAAQAGSASYEAAPNVARSFTINPRAIAVTADAQTKTYGDADPELTYQVTSGSLVDGDVFSGGVSRSGGENAGSYQINQGTLALSANYTLAFSGAEFTISARPLAISADAKSKTYGEADPALTYTLTSGSLIGTDVIGGSLERVSGENAGTYSIHQGTLDAGTNYTVAFTAALLTVQPAPLTVTADNQAKVYGASLPPLTLSYAGFVRGDDAATAFSSAATATTTATQASNVGMYTISAGGGVAPNYTITWGDGTLTITPAPLRITADDKTKVLGDENPALTAAYHGFVNGDGPASLDGPAVLSTAADVTSDVGPWAIAVSGASDANYEIEFVNGTLRILYAPAGTACADGHVILQPIHANGSSVFKAGRTVPAKFKVCTAQGQSIGTPGVVAGFRLVRIQGGTVSDVDAPVTSTTPDTAFRWDATAQQWIFNMSTEGLAANQTYSYSIVLKDATSIDFEFGLR